MFRSLINKFKYKLKVKKLIKSGLKIGVGHRIYTDYMPSEPYLISIGDFVSIGHGVQIIPHDGAVWTLRRYMNNPNIDRFGLIEIGSNVFIGNNSIILPNTSIGNNVIIGANSLVKGVLSENSVYAGSPCKKICTIDEYYSKYEKNFLNTKHLDSYKKRDFILKNLDKL